MVKIHNLTRYSTHDVQSLLSLLLTRLDSIDPSLQRDLILVEFKPEPGEETLVWEVVKSSLGSGSTKHTTGIKRTIMGFPYAQPAQENKSIIKMAALECWINPLEEFSAVHNDRNACLPSIGVRMLAYALLARSSSNSVKHTVPFDLPIKIRADVTAGPPDEHVTDQVIRKAITQCELNEAHVTALEAAELLMSIKPYMKQEIDQQISINSFPQQAIDALAYLDADPHRVTRAQVEDVLLLIKKLL